MPVSAREIPLKTLLRRAAALLPAPEYDTPRHEVMRIWGGFSGESLGDVILENDRMVPQDIAERFLAAVGRRAAGEPLAYVIGTIGFRRLALHADRRALIPRPETESVVEEALSVMRTGIAVDVGTGTGAIALSLRLEGAFDQVIGIDASADALALARENGALTRLEVDWRQGDLVSPLLERGERVDLLVSNPPYLTEDEYGNLDRSVRDFEPRMALVSGSDGMVATVRLLHDGRAVVKEAGWMVLEVDCRRAQAVSALAQELGWVETQVRDDLFGRARCLLARRGNTG